MGGIGIVGNVMSESSVTIGYNLNKTVQSFFVTDLAICLNYLGIYYTKICILHNEMEPTDCFTFTIIHYR